MKSVIANKPKDLTNVGVIGHSFVRRLMTEAPVYKHNKLGLPRDFFMVNMVGRRGAKIPDLYDGYGLFTL